MCSIDFVFLEIRAWSENLEFESRCKNEVYIFFGILVHVHFASGLVFRIFIVSAFRLS